MHLLNIKHYVEKSFRDKPSFVLEMSDGKTYISNGCVFVEMSAANIEFLINKYDCKMYIDALLASTSTEMSSVTDARFMFRGCKILTTFNNDMSSVINASHMFYGCETLIAFDSNMPSAINTVLMFGDCTNLTTFNSDIHPTTDTTCMFHNCILLTKPQPIF